MTIAVHSVQDVCHINLVQWAKLSRIDDSSVIEHPRTSNQEVIGSTPVEKTSTRKYIFFKYACATN